MILKVETQLEEYGKNSDGWNCYSVPIKKSIFKSKLVINDLKIKIIQKHNKVMLKFSRPLIMYGELQNKIRYENGEYANMSSKDRMAYNKLKVQEYKNQSTYKRDLYGDCLFTKVPVDFSKSVLQNPFGKVKMYYMFYLEEN